MSGDFEDIEPLAPAPGGGGMDPGGMFDQAGIDALFGDFDSPAPKVAGLKAVIESKVINQERLPMLEVVFERMVRTFSTSLRNLTSDAIEINVDQLTSVRFGEFMNNVPLPAMIGVFQIPEWENYGIATVESGLIYAVVDALLGGRGNSTPRIEGRNFTTIELTLVGRMLTLALSDLVAAFTPLAQISMTLDRIETNPRFAAIAGPTNLTAVATFRIDMDGRGGALSILLPFATLEPVRSKLLQRFMGEKQGRANIWRDHLAQEIIQTTVSVDVLMAERMIPLREAKAFSVGQHISLGASPDGPVTLSCGGVPLAHGHVGQKGTRIAVRLDSGISAGTDS
jgi:flagellar motor switch protein FliM